MSRYNILLVGWVDLFLSVAGLTLSAWVGLGIKGGGGNLWVFVAIIWLLQCLMLRVTRKPPQCALDQHRMSMRFPQDKPHWQCEACGLKADGINAKGEPTHILV